MKRLPLTLQRDAHATHAASAIPRLFVCAWFMCLFACKSSEPTPLSEVVVQIDADALVQRAGDRLIVEISSGPRTGELSPSEPETFNLTAAGFRWPVTITLVAKPAHEDHVFELNLRLEKNSKVLARGRVQSGFAKGKTLILQKMLGAECLGKLDCSANETCVVNDGRASCESAAVDPDDLPTEVPKSDAGASPSDAGKTDGGGRANDAGRGPGATSDAATSDSGMDAGKCIASGAEDCMNGLDDDCNGAVDCADSACTPFTQCVPDELAFVLVGSEEECPWGYEPFDVVYQDLKDNGCSGCDCQPEAKQCEAYVSIYASLLSCERDSANTGGMPLFDPAVSSCSLPIGKQLDLPTGGYGFNVHVKPSKDACQALGEAKPSEPAWGVSAKRCSARLQRGGCDIGYCALRPDAKAVCWPEAEAGCGAVGSAQTYFVGYDDTRWCEPCSCTAQGGSCSDVGAALTTDTSCRIVEAARRGGEKSCKELSGEAMVFAFGRPSDPECSSASIQNGTLVATGSVNLCCVWP